MHVKKPFRKYKPLFNKTYLKYLGFIVAIAIIMLSKKAAKPLDQPEPFAQSYPILHILKAEELNQHRLLLSFLTLPALTSREKIERELSYKALRKQALQSNTIRSVLWTFDRLEIELRWSENQPIDIDQLLHSLIENSTYNITQDQRKLMVASHYLQNKTPQSLLINTLENQISQSYANATSISNVLQNSPTALLITDEDTPKKVFSDISDQLNQLFSNSPSIGPVNQSQVASWQQHSKILQTTTKAYQQIIASEVKLQTNLQSQIDLLSHFILSNILTNQVNSHELDSRLIRKPIYQHGYQAIILSSNQEIPDNIRQTLSQDITLDLIENHVYKVKGRLLDAYRELVDNKERLFALYSKKMFYGLETQSISIYEEQLDSITNEQILEHIQYLLSANNSVIYLKPNQ